MCVCRWYSPTVIYAVLGVIGEKTILSFRYEVVLGGTISWLSMTISWNHDHLEVVRPRGSTST